MKQITSIIDQAAENSLKERIAKGPPLPGPGSTYEQGFEAGAKWALEILVEVADRCMSMSMITNDGVRCSVPEDLLLKMRMAIR